MELLTKFDRALIEYVFEPVAYWAELFLGFNNFSIARYVLAIWPAAMAGFAFAEGTAWRYIYAVFALFISIGLYISDQRNERMMRPGFGNPQKHSPFHRVLRITVTGISVSFLLFEDRYLKTIGAIGAWLYMYFAACDPMPPTFREKALSMTPGILRR